MTEPNAHLMKVYDTEQVKEANLALAAQIASSVLGLGLMVQDKDRREELKREAEMVNQANRVMETQRMHATINAFKGASAEKYASAAAQSMAKIAAYQVGDLAWDDLDEMEKQAIGQLAGGAIGLAGKGLSWLGKATPMSATARLQQAAGQGGGAGRTLRGWGAGFQRKGRSMQAQAGTGTQKLEHAMRTPKTSPANAAAKPAAKTPVKATPEAAAAAAPARKPLLGWKSKALIGGGLLGTGYLGYKTLQTGRDYMMAPSVSHQRFGAYRPTPGRVSQYGYPVY